jgi:hypothetical protein
MTSKEYLRVIEDGKADPRSHRTLQPVHTQTLVQTTLQTLRSAIRIFYISTMATGIFFLNISTICVERTRVERKKTFLIITMATEDGKYI